MKIIIHKPLKKMPKEEYEDKLLYDFGEFKRFGPAKFISEDEVWPVGTHDDDGEVAFFIYGESQNFNDRNGGFEIKWVEYNENLGIFGGEWFESFVIDSVFKKKDYDKPIINGNITTYENKYEYVWFSMNPTDVVNDFINNNFEKIFLDDKVCYIMGFPMSGKHEAMDRH